MRFNSRPHVAGDVLARLLPFPLGVSIHARTWRATLMIASSTSGGVFQFTPARGGRPQKIVSFLLAEALQKACNADSIPFLPLIVCH